MTVIDTFEILDSNNNYQLKKFNRCVLLISYFKLIVYCNLFSNRANIHVSLMIAHLFTEPGLAY